MEFEGNSKSYQALIAYEDILAFYSVQSTLDKRVEYKKCLLQLGIEKRVIGGDVDEVSWDFYRQYYEYVKEKCPLLKMKFKDVSTTGDNEVYFFPASLLGGMKIIHSTNGRWVGVVLPGDRVKNESFEDTHGHLFPPDSMLEINKTEARLKKEVPRIYRHEAFENQIDNLETILSAISSLEIFIAEDC